MKLTYDNTMRINKLKWEPELPFLCTAKAKY